MEFHGVHRDIYNRIEFKEQKHIWPQNMCIKNIQNCFGEAIFILYEMFTISGLKYRVYFAKMFHKLL